MVCFATDITKQDVRHIWKICFGDSEKFMDMYFTEKYAHENTLVYIEQNKVVAAIQMLPYTMTFYGKEIPVSYISGASTLPEFRNKGYMGKLLLEAFNVMKQRNIPLSILIPAEEWLYGYYERYGYETVFEKNESEIIDLKTILQQSKDMEQAYKLFNVMFRYQDFTIQKSKEDFAAIVKDAEMDGFSLRHNLAGMARIIDAEKLLTYFAHKNDKTFNFHVIDNQITENSGYYQISNKETSHSKNMLNTAAGQISINTLCRLLFGFHLHDIPTSLTQYFNDHTPVMNLMLE